MPEQNCFPLYAGQSLDEGAISEPLAIGVYAVKNSIPLNRATVGILGFGPIGMSVMLAAKASHAKAIFVTDKINQRLRLAQNEGASWTGNPDEINVPDRVREISPQMLDVVFECCGKQEAADQAIDLLKPGGKLMIIGIPEFDRWNFSVDKTRHKEITIQNVRRQVGCVQPALDYMQKDEIRIEHMISHRFPFVKTKEAFDLVAGYKDGAMKVMIDFDYLPSSK